MAIRQAQDGFASCEHRKHHFERVILASEEEIVRNRHQRQQHHQDPSISSFTMIGMRQVSAFSTQYKSAVSVASSVSRFVWSPLGAYWQNQQQQQDMASSKTHPSPLHTQ
jgi:hypothetical protein